MKSKIVKKYFIFESGAQGNGEIYTETDMGPTVQVRRPAPDFTATAFFDNQFKKVNLKFSSTSSFHNFSFFSWSHRRLFYKLSWITLW